MTKPYSIFKRSNGFYYAQFPFSTDGKVFQKSTGCKNRGEAEKTVLKWYSQGTVLPVRTKKLAAEEEKISLERLSFFAQLRKMDFSENEKKEIIDILKSRKIIKAAVLPNTPECIPAEDFLSNFWDYDKSPYVKEKKLKGQSIHKDYCATMNARIKIYWMKRIKGRELGSITKDDVKAFFDDPAVKTLAPKTVNSIISSVTVPLKWAYYNNLIENNCFDGIIKCANKSKQRMILTMEQASAVFKTDWENDSAKLANAVAMYTGMRQGEIAGLRVENIGMDRLYVKHSWSKYDGLKCCKNGDEREIPIAPQLRDALIAQARLNPHGEGMQGFVFFGLKPSQPTDPQNWLKYLHRALKSTGYQNPNEISFHSWRHLWCSRVCDIVKDKRIVMTGSGHKTETMLNHYAEHIETDNVMDKLQRAEAQLFLPVLGEGKRQILHTEQNLLFHGSNEAHCSGVEKRGTAEKISLRYS